MLAGISHDLRTPLTKLRIAVEILRAHGEPALLAGMTRSIAEMDAIVGQFLDYARDDADEPTQLVDVEALLRDVASGFADHGQPLVLELAGLPGLRVRPRSLRRAITNLVENAWRHGRPPVVLATSIDAAAAYAWIEVRDHGGGADPAQLELLKQPFRRGETARGGSAGAGLGLAIAERAALAQGGACELLAADGGGLRARVSVPLAQA
jgi:two-component system osmolarity sensor histidine kinase EnvZ